MVSGLVRRLGPVRLRSVAGCGRQEMKSALPFDEPFSDTPSLVVCGEESQPDLYAGGVLADLCGVLTRLVIRVDGKLGRPGMTAEAFDSPDHAAFLVIKRRLASFVVEGGAADEDDRADGAGRLFLLEGGAKPVYAGVAVEAKWGGVVGYGFPVWVDQDRGFR